MVRTTQQLSLNGGLTNGGHYRTNSSFIASRECFFNEIPKSVLIEITKYIGYKINEDELKERAIASLEKPSVSQTFPRSPCNRWLGMRAEKYAQ